MKGVENQTNSTDDKIESFLKSRLRVTQNSTSHYDNNEVLSP